MKTIFAALILCLSIFSATAQNPTSARGCVIFKRGLDVPARVDEYRKFENLGTNIAVTDIEGRLLTVFPGERPIFIPYPADSSATLEKATAQIAIARKTYPELSRRLATIEKAWAAVPQAKVATVPAKPISPLPPAASKPAPDAVPKGMEIVTTNGTKYENVTITSVEPDGLSISHEAGLVKVPFTDLSEELRAKYNFDPQKAAQFAAATQETAKQKAAAQQKAAADQQVQAEQLKRTKTFDVQVEAVVKGKGAVVTLLSSTAEIANTLFVEGLIGVAQGERYEIAAFRDGTYSGPDWADLQRWMCKSVSKDLRILKQEEQQRRMNQPGVRPRSTSLERIGGG